MYYTEIFKVRIETVLAIRDQGLQTESILSSPPPANELDVTAFLVQVDCYRTGSWTSPRSTTLRHLSVYWHRRKLPPGTYFMPFASGPP